MKASTRLLILLFRARRKVHSIETAKLLLYEIGEWTRIKFVVRKMLNAIKTLQKRCREFIAVKRRRCDIMHKEWVRVEDHRLKSFFHEYAQKVMQLQDKRSALQTAAQREQQKFYKQLQDSVKDGVLQIDWR